MLAYRLRCSSNIKPAWSASHVHRYNESRWWPIEMRKYGQFSRNSKFHFLTYFSYGNNKPDLFHNNLHVQVKKIICD